MRTPSTLLALLCLATFALAASPADAQCVEGAMTSELLTEGPRAGLYKYTLTLSWDTPYGLSHVTLDCGFENCPAEACATEWFFDEPAGYGTGGDPDDCDFEFEGSFLCGGDPSVELVQPVLKWDAIDTDECEAGRTGSAVLSFYTHVGPVMHEVPIVIVKNGQEVCTGEIAGACPLPCATPVEQMTWGTIKLEFRD
jgi:hypothetical protein